MTDNEILSSMFRAICRNEIFNKLILTNYYDQLLDCETELHSYWENCEYGEEIINYINNWQDRNFRTIINDAEENEVITLYEARILIEMYNKVVNFLIKTTPKFNQDSGVTIESKLQKLHNKDYYIWLSETSYKDKLIESETKLVNYARNCNDGKKVQKFAEEYFKPASRKILDKAFSNKIITDYQFHKLDVKYNRFVEFLVRSKSSINQESFKHSAFANVYIPPGTVGKILNHSIEEVIKMKQGL